MDHGHKPETDFRRLFTPPLLTDFLKGHPKQNLWPLTAFEEFWPLCGCDHMLVQYVFLLAMCVCVFFIEDAYGGSPPPPAFLDTPMWPNVGLELGQAIGP